MPLPLSRPRWGALEVSTPGGLRAATLGPALPGRPEIVLVHGLGCSHRYFARLAAELFRLGHAVAAPDLPGFGLTPAPAGRPVADVPALADDLAAWLRATGREGTTLVANSFGAQVLVELAAAHPGAAAGLVLIGPALDQEHPTLRAQAARLVRNTVHEPPRVSLLLGRDYVACGVRRYLATARAGLAHRTRERLRQVSVPVTVVRGALDPLSSAPWAREVAALAGGDYVEVPGASHLVHWSRPEAVADAVLRLATDQDTGPAAPSSRR